jgi:DNA topoisomerase-1
MPLDESSEASSAVLRHSSDTEPGIARKRVGRYWAYYDPGGERITDRAEIDRLNAIGLPPAYTDAWFCTDPDGHLQATGVDDRRRKQYRYHPLFRARAEKKKFASLLDFGRALPRLRARVEKDLGRPKLTRETVLAAVVRLLDEAHLRIGNPEYARENKSFGATTLLNRHVRESGRKLKMRFTGKGGRTQEVTITDRRLARIVRKCHDLPGQLLFQYINGEGEPQPISSADVNDYVREASGGDFTAKHFRTWGASVIAFEKMLERSQEQRKVSVATIVEPAAEALGNTVAISRKSYVHPALIDAVKADPRDPLDGMDPPRGRKGLSAPEVGLLEFLERSSAA